MAVYQTKTFARWAKKTGLRDAELYTAAQEVVAGQVEAKLGGNVYKKRVALPGGGKSGGSRTLIATRIGKHSFFLYGFEKNERSNIKANELSVLKSAAKVWLSMTADGLTAALKAGEIKEVKRDE
ncbi:type II toxin-antitoxin system RelE/ParE family toxin [Seongchinamella sediminis]|uniref:Type II toxin-antitoxin system RelE/ParE family toxin n=1 Tax=Seongchinamella sediminis TaxID=2283635 RepID=A0A3L7DVF0_9GAMM|nr:type II toxin-antitoxin system RelE/ParE family toxin [Seongchinamella sediminis]RLQ21547.1 type II toxin-antitoxin system RelE/ParE family toxin [Seongchinamella sediminis]